MVGGFELGIFSVENTRRWQLSYKAFDKKLEFYILIIWLLCTWKHRIAVKNWNLAGSISAVNSIIVKIKVIIFAIAKKSFKKV